jgi:DNA polymerase-3 subunit beta
MNADEKAFVLKSDLVAALRAVAPAVPKKTRLPILQGVKITADRQTVTLEATDLEFGVKRTITADVFEPFTTVLPHKLLFDIAKTRDYAVTLTASGVDGATLQPLDADDFPSLFHGFEDAAHVATVDGKELERITNTVAHAADGLKSFRPVFQCVYLHGKKGNLNAVCADGFRLAVSSTAYEGADLKLLIPARLGAVLKAQKINGPVEIRAGASCAWFTWTGGALVARLIEGTFPDYQQIIPRESASFFRVDADVLARTMKQIRPFTIYNNDVARFKLGALNGSLPVVGKSADAGEITVNMPVEHSPVDALQWTETAQASRYTDWKPVEPTQDLALNERYVTALATTMKGKRLTVGVNLPTQAVKITVDGSSDQFVIMPLVTGA